MKNWTHIALPLGGDLLLLPRFRTRALVLIPVVLLFLLAGGGTTFAASAKWKAAPATGGWNTAANWTPPTVPNSSGDTATFAASNRIYTQPCRSGAWSYTLTRCYAVAALFATAHSTSPRLTGLAVCSAASKRTISTSER